MSKLSILKQEAYQAGKKRDWSRAVFVYEQILELDKNNPTVINELGDLCLKSGDPQRGVKHFLNAAAKYRQSGLLNNAVAIYKKILRYDDSNQNAHWYLCESRANQGLMVEGEHHALIFLVDRESLSGDIKEIFLKRCTKLFELYPESQPIQENLLQVFRMWNMPLDAGRIQIRLACFMWKSGDQESAAAEVSEALGSAPELANYPEHAQWLQLQGKTQETAPVQDFDSVALEDPFAQTVSKDVPETPEVHEIPETHDPFAVTNDPPAPVVDIPVEPVQENVSFGDVSFDAPEPSDSPETPETTFGLPPRAPEDIPAAEQVLPPEEVVPDDSGCFTLDDGDDTSFEDLIAQATQNTPEIEPEPEVTASVEIPDESAPVNLLDELLADDSSAEWSNPTGELKTISDEIGSQVGGSEGAEDPSSLYEMGMVYLEMALYDKAAESFQKASCHREFSVRAYEMWGITLQRANRIDEAIAVLTDGLDVPEEGSAEYLGLLYHIARAHEQNKNVDEAQRLFEMILNQDPGFLDVSRRLSQYAR